jgi:hypothetical protein
MRPPGPDGHAGLLPLRLLAERTGLRAGLSAAMRRRDSSPLYDRGQILADLALVLIGGGEVISNFQALAHLTMRRSGAASPLTVVARGRNPMGLGLFAPRALWLACVGTCARHRCLQ